MVIFSEDLRTDSGRMLERQILARVPDARVIYVDPRSAAGMKPSVVEAVEAAEHVIAAVYVVPTAGKAMRAVGGGLTNTVAMDDATGALLTAILDRAAKRTVVLAMGNPYVVQDFPAIQNYLCAFSNVTVSETAAVKAIFGEIPIGGHLPVTIPGIASRGAGIERPGAASLSSTQLRRFLPCSALKCSAVKCSAAAAIAKLSLGALFAALCVLPACSINANDKARMARSNVDIKSPMGDLHVSEQADIRDAGLTLYPGAKPAPKEDGDDKKSANVNLSLPGFSLKVVAAEFLSDDAPDKIIAYYDKELQKYGKPIQCHGGWNGGHANYDTTARMNVQAGVVWEWGQWRRGGVEGRNRGQPAHRFR